MSSAGAASLTRQSGLLLEMQAVANNIANLSTTGFRREGLGFSEFVAALQPGEPSLSMATADVRLTDDTQGPLTGTGGTYDFAIEGAGYFLLESADGPALTRAGNFTPNAEGELSAPDGARLLDAGGAPVFVPPDAQSVALASDGTLSADGRPIAWIGLYAPASPSDLTRRQGVRFSVAGDVQAVEGGTILQGFVEGSNVDPISEIARMIQVQHAYEMGQQFLDKEDQRVRAVLQTLGR